MNDPRETLKPMREETDRQMLEWLRGRLSHFAEGGGNRRYVDAIISRIAELIEEQASFKHSLTTLQDAAHKLAEAQMQFAKSFVRQLERPVGRLEAIQHSNGSDALPAGKTDPAVELKGE